MNKQGPAYQILPIPLSTAGTKPFIGQGTRVTLVGATDASGNDYYSVKLKVRVGINSFDQVPMAWNTEIKANDKFDELHFEWAAQSGVTAYILITDDGGLEVSAPPAKQIVTSSVGSTLAAAAVTVGTAAAQVAAAASTRQKLTIKNNSTTATLYLGADNTVTTATGLPLGPGEGFTVEGTTAAVWGIASAAGTDVRTLEEA